MRVLTPTLSPTLATESATVRLFFLSALLCSVNKAVCDFAHARPIMHCIHLVYIRSTVRRALNLLRASAVSAGIYCTDLKKLGAFRAIFPWQWRLFAFSVQREDATLSVVSVVILLFSLVVLNFYILVLFHDSHPCEVLP